MRGSDQNRSAGDMIDSSFARSKEQGATTMADRLAVSTNTYHTYSLEEALAGIAASGFTSVELVSVPGWTEHVRRDADDAEDAELAHSNAARFVWPDRHQPQRAFRLGQCRRCRRIPKGTADRACARHPLGHDQYGGSRRLAGGIARCATGGVPGSDSTARR